MGGDVGSTREVEDESGGSILKGLKSLEEMDCDFGVEGAAVVQSAGDEGLVIFRWSSVVAI